MDVRVRGGELAVHAGGAGGGGGRHRDERGPVQAGVQAGGRARYHVPRKEIMRYQSYKLLHCLNVILCAVAMEHESRKRYFFTELDDSVHNQIISLGRVHASLTHCKLIEKIFVIKICIYYCAI